MSLERSSGSYTVCIESSVVRDLSLSALDQARKRIAEQAADEPGLRQPTVFFNHSAGVIVVIFQTEAADFAQVAQFAVGLFTQVLGADEAPPVQTLFIEHGPPEGGRPTAPEVRRRAPRAAPRGAKRRAGGAR